MNTSVITEIQIFDIDSHLKEEQRKQEIYMRYRDTEHGKLAIFIDNNYEGINVEFDSNSLMLYIEIIDFNIVHKFIDVLDELNSDAIDMIRII